LTGNCCPDGCGLPLNVLAILHYTGLTKGITLTHKSVVPQSVKTAFLMNPTEIVYFTDYLELRPYFVF
jgi:hypothetical protein